MCGFAPRRRHSAGVTPTVSLALSAPDCQQPMATSIVLRKHLYQLPVFAPAPIMKTLNGLQGSRPMINLSPNLPPDKQREMLRQMLTIRRFEERASADYLSGKIYGVVHCYIGEEAV